MWSFPLTALFTSSIISFGTVASHGECRFSPRYSTDEIVHAPDSFISDVFKWEGGFHQNNVGYNIHNGMTYDYAVLDIDTGLVSETSGWSTPRNEAYHIILLAHAINGSHLAQQFVLPSDPASAPVLATALLKIKLQTYLKFNLTFPGYAGFLPSFTVGKEEIWPSAYVNNHSPNPPGGVVHAADNGQLLWAVYGMAVMLRNSKDVELLKLSRGWLHWLSYASINAKGVFLNGPQQGEICKAATLKPGVYPYATRQKYSCDNDRQLEDDPYEGETMAWYLHFSMLYNPYRTQSNSTVVDEMWIRKRSKLAALDYSGSVANGTSPLRGTQNYTSQAISGRHIKPITVQKGKYFASNEQIKLLYLPYLDVPIVKSIFRNAETVRTCNSVLMTSTPGMFAATSNPAARQFDVRITNSGIPSVAFIKDQNLDVVTPYAAFPTILFDRWIGLTWYKIMLDGPRMQSIYGSTAGIRRDASSTANIVSWETKGPTLLALLGGAAGFVREGLELSGVYQEFIDVLTTEYESRFNLTRNRISPLLGKDVPFCLPNAQFPTSPLWDFTSCKTV